MSIGRRLLKLRKEITILKFDVSRGAYHDEHLTSLRRYIDDVLTACGTPGMRISGFSGVTPAVVKSIRGGGRPKLPNFLRVCSALLLILSEKLVDLGLLVRTDPMDFGGSDWVRLEKLTSHGEVMALASILEGFNDAVRSQNDLGKILSEGHRQELIELLQTAIIQLKGPLVDLKLFWSIRKK